MGQQVAARVSEGAFDDLAAEAVKELREQKPVPFHELLDQRGMQVPAEYTMQVPTCKFPQNIPCRIYHASSKMQVPAEYTEIVLAMRNGRSKVSAL